MVAMDRNCCRSRGCGIVVCLIIMSWKRIFVKRECISFNEIKRISGEKMKIVNIMNFVRRIDERMENSTERLLAFAAEELALVNEYGVDNTFLLQYDAVCDEDFVSLFKNKATNKTELGLWYEIVEPLTSACGIP